jgi:hypothetical protein
VQNLSTRADELDFFADGGNARSIRDMMDIGFAHIACAGDEDFVLNGCSKDEGDEKCDDDDEGTHY